MAAAANAGRKAAHPHLKLMASRTPGKDSGGRDIPDAVNFARALPVKPATLSPDAEWLWDEVLEQMKTVGVLKPLDAASLEIACETFARWREAVRFRRDHALLAKNSQGTVAAPWIGIEERASKDFRAWAAEFGFTPASEKNLVSGDADNGQEGNVF